MTIKNFCDYKDKITYLNKRIENIENKLETENSPEDIINLKLSMRLLILDKINTNNNYRYIFCDHPIWYLNNNSYNNKKQKHYYDCTCVVCEVDRIAPKEEFENIIITNDNYNFEDIQNVFYNLYKTNNFDATVTGKILSKRLNQKTKTN